MNKQQEIAKHAYHPALNRFGLHLVGIGEDERYADLQRQLAEKAQREAEFRAKMIAAQK